MKRIIFIAGLSLIVFYCLSLIPTQAAGPEPAVVSAEPMITTQVEALTSKPVSSGSVKIEGHKLWVDLDTNGDGIGDGYTDFKIKGVGYSPFPIGRHVSDWGSNIFDDQEILKRDFALLKAMGANTIRIWKGDNTESAGRFKTKLTQNTLNLANQYSLKVIAGFWVDTSGSECVSGQRVFHAPDFTSASVRADIVNRFAAYVTAFKDSPAILFWAIGNENNLHFDPNNAVQIQAFYSLANEMAARAYQIEGTNYHPVAVVNGNLLYIGDSAKGTSDAQLPNIDIWGANVYTGNSFGTLFSEFASKSPGKVLWVSEFGLDAFHTADFSNPANGGYPDETTQAQWLGNLWDEISANGNVCIGATVMEYSDEWWKDYEWAPGQNVSVHQFEFGSGPIHNACGDNWDPAAPDLYFNAEYWGIVAIAPDGPDINMVDDISPRPVYCTLKNKFSDIIGSGIFYYAGPENNKSCDGSRTCCSSTAYVSKNGACVSRCYTGCTAIMIKKGLCGKQATAVENVAY